MTQTITAMLEGGPLDGRSIQVPADEDGRAPAHLGDHWEVFSDWLRGQDQHDGFTYTRHRRGVDPEQWIYRVADDNRSRADTP